MVSRSDRRSLALLAPLFGALLTACRAGLPPEPPGAEVADASAEVPPYQPPANPYQTSAFAGENPAPSTGHEHMNHMNMNHGSSAASGQAPVPTGHENMDHGVKADKPKASTDAMPANMHMPPEPKR